MRKYLLYGHGGSENHGCEALVRTTVSLLNNDKGKIVLSSYSPEMDYKYHIDEICCIKQRGARKTTSKFNVDFLKAYADLKFKRNPEALDDLYELKALEIKRGDVAVSIGGDNYCYGGTKVLTKENKLYQKGGLKTVLWGCSIEPELLKNERIADDIKGFDLITARESVSYEAIKQINPNTVLVCDSAFLLDKKEQPLPEELEGCDFVGINSSPMIEENEVSVGMARENYCKLIEKILDQTDMKILLIPHVVWKQNDDRVVLRRHR